MSTQRKLKSTELILLASPVLLIIGVGTLLSNRPSPLPDRPIPARWIPMGNYLSVAQVKISKSSPGVTKLNNGADTKIKVALRYSGPLPQHSINFNIGDTKPNRVSPFPILVDAKGKPHDNYSLATDDNDIRHN